MESNAYHYRDAIRTIGEKVNVEAETAACIILGSAEPIRHAYVEKASEANKSIVAGGKFPYLADVADELLNLLDIEKTEERHRRAETLCYTTGCIDRAYEKVAMYRDMWGGGYTSIHDMPEEWDGKRAVLTGTQSLDWMTTKKKDEPVKLIVRHDRYGYQRPRMRTRMFRPQLDADLFVKLTD